MLMRQRLILETGANGYVDLNRVCILDAVSCAASGLVLTSELKTRSKY
jgi:hypothetical protein